MLINLLKTHDAFSVCVYSFPELVGEGETITIKQEELTEHQNDNPSGYERNETVKIITVVTTTVALFVFLVKKCIWNGKSPYQCVIFGIDENMTEHNVKTT